MSRNVKKIQVFIEDYSDIVINHVFCPLLSSGCRMSCNTSVIHVQVSSAGQAQRAPVHLMPCEIEHNGPAQVTQYFTATTKDRKQGTITKCLIAVRFFVLSFFSYRLELIAADPVCS